MVERQGQAPGGQVALHEVIAGQGQALARNRRIDRQRRLVEAHVPRCRLQRLLEHLAKEVGPEVVRVVQQGVSLQLLEVGRGALCLQQRRAAHGHDALGQKQFGIERWAKRRAPVAHGKVHTLRAKL
ncbi:hypothetical protein D3C76_1502900 [compost metagenome]